ncbi:MAG: hypothetical protein ACXAEU_00695 [Candidatus Hodarchaeales archaeon]
MMDQEIEFVFYLLSFVINPKPNHSLDTFRKEKKALFGVLLPFTTRLFHVLIDY